MTTIKTKFQAPHKLLPNKILHYRFQGETKTYLYKENEEDGEESTNSGGFLKISESYNLPEEHRGCLLMGIHFAVSPV